VRCAGHIAAARLSGFDEPGAARVVAAGDVALDKPRLFLLSRVAVAWKQRFEAPPDPALLMCDQQIVGWFAPAGAAGPPASFLSRLSAPDTNAMLRMELSGRVVRHVWELVTLNRAQLSEDIREAAGAESVELPAHVRGVGWRAGFCATGPQCPHRAGRSR
jgi:hypothetical protein